MFGTGFGMGFFLYLAKERQSKIWVLPALSLLVIGKYYGDMKRNQHIKECELEEYCYKTNALESHLRYME
jgi:hypothetical protein